MYPNYTRRSIILSQELRAKLISCYPESQEKEDEGDNGSRDLELALLQGNSAAIQGITNLMQSKKNITINRDANGLMESLTVM